MRPPKWFKIEPLVPTAVHDPPLRLPHVDDTASSSGGSFEDDCDGAASDGTESVGSVSGIVTPVLLQADAPHAPPSPVLPHVIDTAPASPVVPISHRLRNVRARTAQALALRVSPAAPPERPSQPAMALGRRTQRAAHAVRTSTPMAQAPARHML